eukprot:CAMPEP_0194117656 /NCGR_PEP_ID=MMETSP0150-20130528/32242_1 /TAXON_ID=122233 /ORGANISM="Chaetoceros debilis, Strain MM31A-1" /LENGTH=403 /DNA_ID=CAMNT_0038808773 /DNA_START=347 /DNA_END=1558 /DNA_ORIENTATION=+
MASDTKAENSSSGLIATSVMSTSADTLVKSESDRVHGTDSNMVGGFIHQERHYTTEADIFYQKHKKLPNPKIIHDSLNNMIRHENCRQISMNTKGNQPPTELNNNPFKILVIGDVHGCFNEMKTLVEEASKDFNSNQPFTAVVLVGDLCNKGPFSAETLRYVRTQPYWYSVRGNHDNAALSAALGDEKRLDNGNYKWVSNLSDEDVHWLANLPYTITIPRSMILDKKHNEDDASNRMDEDIIIVHAGLIPGVPLGQQDVKTMTTVREVIEVKNKSDSSGRNVVPRIGTHRQNIKDKEGCSQRQNKHVEGLSYEYYSNISSDENKKFGEHYPWATVWQGPQQIIFGHDAKRGFQAQNFALGLDTGCCYGKKLTGKELFMLMLKKIIVRLGTFEDLLPTPSTWIL